MEIVPYSTSKKPHSSTTRVFHCPKRSQFSGSSLDNTISSSFRKPLDSKHRSSTFPSDEDCQSFATDFKQTVPESTSQKTVRKRKTDNSNIQLFVNPAEAKIPRTRSRPIAYLSTHHALAPATNPAQRSDRFIPCRSDHSVFITKHRIRRLPGDLNASEKLLRQQECSKDPFDRRRSRGILPPYRRDCLQAPHMSPHLVDDQAIPSQYHLQRRRITPRQVSIGGVWNVGGSSIAIGGPRPDGHRGLFKSKATAPMHIARYAYSHYISSSEELGMNQSRLAIAFDVDLTHRQLAIPKPSAPTSIRISPSSPHYEKFCPITWKDCMWKRAEFLPRADQCQPTQAAPKTPFFLLFTPDIKDDFYCSVLAYCRTSELLAYAMMDIVYLWSTSTGERVAAIAIGHPNADHVTGLAFSSPEGQQSILAAATWSGYVYLWSTVRSQPRRIWQYHVPISCVAFKQTITRRRSTISPGVEAPFEDLAVGDATGVVWYYCVESSNLDSLSKVTLLARIDAHCGCICGISWSPDDRYLATSGDDDACLLFDLNRILSNHHSLPSTRPPLVSNQLLSSQQPSQAGLNSTIRSRFLSIFRRLSNLETGSSSSGTPSPSNSSGLSSISDSLEPLRFVLGIGQNRRRHNPETERYQRPSGTVSGMSEGLQAARVSRSRDTSHTSSVGHSNLQKIQTTAFIPYDSQTHRFMHYSAVKAIAFAPWQPTLLATGGGMSDRTVHFYHAPSGSCLGKIYMWAQVTGLIWSTTRREIAVILGFPEPHHPFRIAVFAWPSCEQVAAIPWNVNSEGQVFPDVHVSERALSAISVPNFNFPPFDSEGDAASADDECIAVASSDFIRFYRIWSKPHKHFAGSTGILHSSILESLDGIEDPGNEIIR